MRKIAKKIISRINRYCKNSEYEVVRESGRRLRKRIAKLNLGLETTSLNL